MRFAVWRLVSFLALGVTCACGGQTGGGPSWVGGAAGAGASGGTSGGGTGGITPPGCTLEVTAQGPLPSLSQGSRTGPDIVATDTGFALGFREQSGADFRAAFLHVSDAGLATDPVMFDLSGCAQKTPADGVALAYRDGKGMFATSLPDCNTGAGAMFVPFDGNGTVATAAGTRNSSYTELGLAPSAALAPASSPNEYDFVYRLAATEATPVVERVILQGPSFKKIPTLHPFGESDVGFGMVASTPTLRAYLAPNPAKGSLELHVGPASGDTIEVEDKSSFPLSSYAAITAWGERVAVGVATGSVLLVRVLERSTGGPNVVAEASMNVPAPSNARLAVLGDRLIVASGAQGAIAISLVSGASSIPYFDAVQGATKIVSSSSEHLSVAAARGRIALTWVSTLPSSDPGGGWMLLSCAE